MTNKTWTKDRLDILEENYGKLSYSEIAELLGVSKGQVKYARYRYIKSNVGQGKSQFSRKSIKYGVNDEFFSQKTPESLYWAGFIAADGCIYDKAATHSMSLKVELQGSDVDHLMKLKSCLESESPITIRQYTRSYKGVEKVYKASCIVITSTKICEDLKRLYNITPRKSLTYSCPELAPSDFKHFIRGYLDGDGSISKSGEGRWDSRVQILGTESLCNYVGKFCEGLGIKLSNKCIRARENIYSITLTHLAGRLFLGEIYDEDLRLDRKWWFTREMCYNYTDPRKKLTNENLMEIFELSSYGFLQSEIAGLYSVHQVTISKVLLGKYGKGKA